MHLRLVQFSLGAGKRSEAEGIADEVVPLIRAQPGGVGCTFFADDEAGDYGVVVVWASREAAESAASVVSPVLMSAVARAGGTIESRRLFDVYEPRER